MLLVRVAAPDLALRREPILRVLARRATPLLVQFKSAEPDLGLEIGRGVLLMDAAVAVFRHLQDVFAGLGFGGARGFCSGHVFTP